MTSQSLHRLGGKLLNDYRATGLSDRQEGLWSWIVDELEYRNRRRIVRDRCSCLICVGPFVEEDPSDVDRLEGIVAAEARLADARRS